MAVRVGLAGAGQFGVTLASAIARCREVELTAVADMDLARAESVLALSAPGRPATRLSREAPMPASPDSGTGMLCTDPLLLADLDLEVVVEATGHPEIGAGLAVASIARGRHVVMASKEVESVVGPLLAARARDAGVVYSMADGDQPSLLVGLIDRARSMGLSIVSAGKSTEFDYVWSADAGTVSAQEVQISVPDMASLWALQHPPRVSLARRAEVLASLPRRTAADLCEMVVTANAVEMMPDTEHLLAPVLRTGEVPEVFRPAHAGGVLQGDGTLGVFQCLRREDEPGFAGGVFVVVEWPGGETARLLAGKGIPTSRDGRHGMLHNPVHLLGVEALVTILHAACAGRPTAAASRPVVELVARARRDLGAGEELSMGGHFHEIEACDPLVLPARTLGAANPAPYYLASNATLSRPVGHGSLITVADLVEPPDSFLWRTRREQDERFHGGDPEDPVNRSTHATPRPDN